MSSKTFRGRFGIGGSIRGVGSKGRNETATIREPETAEGAEDAGWITVAEDPFKDTTDDHEKTAHKHVNSAETMLAVFRGKGYQSRTYLEAAPLPPAPRQPIRSQVRGVKARRKPTRALQSC